MTRLPSPGNDDGAWGTILNDFLSQSHNSDGTLKSSTIDATKLATSSSPSSGQVLTYSGGKLAWTTPVAGSGGGSGVTTVNTRDGDVVLTKSDVGLANVDNTSDLNKPISTTTQTALGTKANTVDVYTKTQVDTSLAAKISVSQVGAANGVASLDNSGMATISELPSGIILYVKYNGSAWPSRPTSRADIQVRWEAATSSDPDPTDYVAGVDYLERPAS